MMTGFVGPGIMGSAMALHLADEAGQTLFAEVCRVVRP